MARDATIEFENDRVRVTRVRADQRGAGAPGSRLDRLIVYLHDGHVTRTVDGQKEEIRRKAGDAIWRDRSHHHIEHLEDGKHEVLVIEIK
jgi:quercetin dioxygenase-like cupin family protein